MISGSTPLGQPGLVGLGNAKWRHVPAMMIPAAFAAFGCVLRAGRIVSKRTVADVGRAVVPLGALCGSRLFRPSLLLSLVQPASVAVISRGRQQMHVEDFACELRSAIRQFALAGWNSSRSRVQRRRTGTRERHRRRIFVQISPLVPSGLELGVQAASVVL